MVGDNIDTADASARVRRRGAVTDDRNMLCDDRVEDAQPCATALDCTTWVTDRGKGAVPDGESTLMFFLLLPFQIGLDGGTVVADCTVAGASFCSGRMVIVMRPPMAA
eukprot:gene38148-13981_t